MNKDTQHSVTVKNKKHIYTIVPQKDGVTTVVRCDAAELNQQFINEDVPALLADLPNLIIAEQEYSKSQNAVVHFRLRAEEKLRVEKRAIKNGFNTISGYMRHLALA